MSNCNCKIVTPGKERKKQYGKVGIKHHERLYYLWCNIKYRCKKGTGYERNYALRGIGVCEQWLADFHEFRKDMGPRPSPKHSVDRKDNDRGYCPHNCRWATAYQQVLNSRQIVKKGKLPRWVNLTVNGTYQVKRAVGGGVVEYLGTYKTVSEAVKAIKNWK